MATFVIERNIPGASGLTADQLREIAATSHEVVDSLGLAYTWHHSYVANDKIYCVHETHDAETVREHARRGGFPADGTGMVPMRRARNRTRSVVASSAQCRSSTTRTRGRVRNAASTAAKISCWAADSRSLVVTAGPSASATSRRGPSGRGVLSGTHRPHRTGIEACSQNARSSDVLPMPASAAEQDEGACARSGPIRSGLQHLDGMLALQ